MTKVALVHDWLTNLGGGERVLEAMQEAYPHAPIYTSVYDSSRIDLFKNSDVRTSFLQHWPLAIRKHQLYPTLRTLAFESFDFSGYDIVISSSSAESKGIVTPTETTHIAYIHTPTRYYWSSYEEYLKQPGMGALNPLFKVVLPRVVKKMRLWDYAASQRPDVMLANSKTVAKRIKKYYHRDSTVVYPPVDISRFTPTTKNSDYYLVVSRLIPYKRIDLAVKACNKLGRNLKIAGSGPELKNLQSIAGPTIDFIISPSDTEVARLYEKCRALIFTAYEDFGITPVECMSAGRPVITYGKGGASESVVNNKTGLFFNNQTDKAITESILEFEQMHYSPEEIRDRAEDFSKERFISQIHEIVNSKALKSG